MTTTTRHPDLQSGQASSPLPVIRLATAFYQSRVLMSALELDVFGALADAPATEPDLRERLGLHPRGSRDFFDSLVALGLLNRDEGRYANSELASQFLRHDISGYAGGFAEMTGHVLYHVWADLTKALRTGEPQVSLTANFLDDTVYKDKEGTRKFMSALDAVNGRAAAELGSELDWSRYSTLCDIGGARGNMAAILVKAHPHLRATCFDLPAVEPLFDEHMAALEVGDRVRYQAGDFESDPLPAADVMILGHVLHGFGEPARRSLIAKIVGALSPGGLVCVYDRMIDDDRRGDIVSLTGSLNMLITTRAGSEYTVSDGCARLVAAGLEIVTTKPIAGTDTLVVARKPVA